MITEIYVPRAELAAFMDAARDAAARSGAPTSSTARSA